MEKSSQKVPVEEGSTKPKKESTGQLVTIIATVVLTAVVMSAVFALKVKKYSTYPKDKVRQDAMVEKTDVDETVMEKEAMMIYAPIPDASKGVIIDQEKGYLVEEVADGLYWVTDGTYQVMFLTTGEGVIAVDAPPSLGERYLQAIAEVTDEPITHVIYSHSHADHIAAAGMFPDDAIFIAHEDTATQLKRAMGSERTFPYGMFVGGLPIPLPTSTFADSMTLEVGNKILELSYKGPAHEPGNIFIYAPEQKVLYLIDVIFPGWSPFKDLAVAEDVPSFVSAHDQVLVYDFDTMISGHLGRRATREDVEVQKEYVEDMQAAAASALQTVDFMAIAADVGFENTWLLFDTYLLALEDACEESVVPVWKDRLGAVDVFTASHCARLIESLRID